MAASLPVTGPARSLVPEPRALSAARRHTGSIEDKVITYFTELPGAPAALAGAHRLLRILSLVALLGGLLALVAGAATLRTAFSAEGGIEVNFHWAVASLLGLNTLTLIIWLVMIALAPRAAGENSLGAALLGLWRMGLRKFGGRGNATSRAATAVGRRIGAARLWVVSSISHGLWLAFLSGGVVMALILLSTQQYVFRWETTILNARSYIALTDALSWLPRTLGFTVPSDAAIRAAQWTGGDLPAGADQAGWASLLFACLLLYGIAPRLVLLLFSLWRARRLWRAPLDLSRPEFAALIPHLAPVVEQTRIVSPAPDGQAWGDGGRISRPADLPPPGGPVALLGWEVETGNALPQGPGLDLGMIDGGAALERALSALAGQRPRVARLLVIADLTGTPDRGVTAGLKRLAAAAPETVMLFTGGAALVERLGQREAADRLTDWVSAAHAVGIALDHMVEIDLERPNAETARQWRALMGRTA